MSLDIQVESCRDAQAEHCARFVIFHVLSVPTVLPLPYLNITSRLGPLPSLTPSSLFSLYQAHLSLHPVSSSHNVVLSDSGFLHTIPRSSRETNLPPPPSLASEEFAEPLRFGPNGLGFAGYSFLKPGDEAYLQEYGVGRALMEVGFPRQAA